jgi:uracil phosphoribosyltransferase
MQATMKKNTKYLEHKYGENYRILDDVFLNTHLANLCKEKTKQPIANYIIADLYDYLIKEVINQEFPTKEETVRTRMAALTAKGFWHGEIIDPEQAAVVVDIARAGTLPSETCFKVLNQTLNPDLVRQDHVYMARKTNDKGEVIGSDWSGSKIGGGKDKAIVIIPDPMGATGGSISSCIDHYKKNVEGKELKFISIHLITTPEYIQRMKLDHPEISVYAIRLDRGMSSDAALKEIPGTIPEEESGLNETQYIVPGAGGLGEVMNNSYC